MATLKGDLRLGLRMLAKKPSLSFLAVLILALGIGANTAIFSVVNGVLLAPLPYPDADRLVQVWNVYPLMGLPQASVSIPDYLDRREGVAAFEESALYNFQSFNLADEGPPERVVGARATASLFPLLQVAPALGSPFGEAEEEVGRDRVVVLSHDLWQSRFGGEAEIVGRDVRLNGEPYRVSGVMPAGFQFPSPTVKLWVPFAFTAEQRTDDERGNEYSRMLARLAPGAGLEQAREQIAAIHEANKERLPEAREFWETSGFGGTAISYRDELYGDLRPILLLLQAVVGFVLLIACANVANLLLTRLSAREKELAVRTALGADRWRLARQVLIESLLLALVGGALGVWLGYLGMDLLTWLGVEDAAERGIRAQLDGGVLLFTLGLSLLTGVVFGAFPILSLRHSDPNTVLKEGGRGDAGGRRASLPRNLLVVAEVAVAVVLLVGAGLLVRTLAALQDEDPGFSSRGVITARVSLPAAKYAESHQVVGFYERVLERLRALPGVSAAGLISDAPFSGSSSSGSYTVEGYEPGPGESRPHAFQRIVDEDYFRALEIALLQGRGFERTDTAEGEQVVIVDRTLVEKYFPDEDPIGQRLSRGGDTSFTIVGVVEPVKIASLDQPVTKETIYYPYRQVPRPTMTFVVETAGAPAALAEPLRAAILEIDPEQPIYDVTTIEEQMAGTLQPRKVSMVLLVAFGGLAVLLAAVGLYGVLAFSTAQRTREMGLRMALGARARNILELVLGQGMALVAIGLAAGLGLALLLSFLLSRFLADMLYRVEVYDPLTLTGVCLLLGVVSLLACYRPARRATRVDPMVALREE